MKGAIVVCAPPVQLLTELVTIASELSLGVSIGGDSVQLSDPEGRLLTMFDNAEPDWEWRNATLLGSGEAVDLGCLTGYAVECRWEQMFCEVIGALDARVGSLWVVDGDGVLWPAKQLDASRIQL